jgi:phage baseplate assembly protein W
MITTSTFNVRNLFDNDGNLVMLTNENAINQNISNLILTSMNELVGDPQYGTQLQKCYFNNMTSYLYEFILDHIQEQIYKYDKRISITNIDLTFDPAKGLCALTLNYSYNETTSVVTLFVNIGE